MRSCSNHSAQQLPPNKTVLSKKEFHRFHTGTGLSSCMLSGLPRFATWLPFCRLQEVPFAYCAGVGVVFPKFEWDVLLPNGKVWSPLSRRKSSGILDNRRLLLSAV